MTKCNMINRRKYRFFYHYYKQYKCMSVHYRGICYRSKNVVCEVPSETKWNDKSQPNLVIQGWAKDIIINEKEDKITII